MILCTDATVGDDGSVIGDPTEAAFVVLAAKMGADAEHTRKALPRLAEVPFDSEYKFMATFHDCPDWLAGGILRQPHFATVKGAPDVVIDRCGQALRHGQQVPIDTVRDEILTANRTLSNGDCGCSRSPPATWTTPGCQRPWPTRWQRSPT
ncbi:MAG TPA: hypothetical protein VFW65_00170 [Pseudonocardiaceae bacterium]|nr:hypothetical protein [Pseudonocardiaceae bacterium]